MAIDYNLLFRQQAPQGLEGLTQGMASGMKISEMAGLQRQRQREEQKQKDLNEIYNQSVQMGQDGRPQLNASALAQGLISRGYGQEAAQLAEQARASDAQKQKELGGMILNAYKFTSKNPQSWPQVRQALIQKGLNAQDLPEQWNQQQMDGMIAPLMNYQDQLKEQEALLNLDRIKADIGLTRAKTAGEYRAQNQNKVDFSIENKFREELTKNPTIKDFASAAIAYRGIQSTLTGPPSAAKDMASIFQFMKVLDPTSTVREGEFANAQNAAGVPDRIRNLFNRAASGEMLNEQQRSEFLSTAKELYQARQEAAKQVKKSFEPIIARQGANPQNVFDALNYDVPEKPAEQKQTVPASSKQIPKTIIQNGFIYNYNEKTGQYE